MVHGYDDGHIAPLMCNKITHEWSNFKRYVRVLLMPVGFYISLWSLHQETILGTVQHHFNMAKDNIVECRFNAVQYNKILCTLLQWWGQNINQTESTKDTPYLLLMGELWCIFCNNFGENWPCYNNGTTLYNTADSTAKIWWTKNLDHTLSSQKTSQITKLNVANMGATWVLSAPTLAPWTLLSGIPYLSLAGKLWGVYYEYLEAEWPSQNGTGL